MDGDGIALVIDCALQNLLANQVRGRDGSTVGQLDAAVAPDGRCEMPFGELGSLLAQEEDVKL